MRWDRDIHRWLVYYVAGNMAIFAREQMEVLLMELMCTAAVGMNQLSSVA